MVQSQLSKVTEGKVKIATVAERKNFKLLFSAGIVLPLGFQFIYFFQFE